MSNNITLFLIIILLVVIIFIIYNKQENLDASSLSNEALQNIAKVYGDKDGIVSFNNMNVTGKINGSGYNIDSSGNITSANITSGNITGNTIIVDRICDKAGICV